MAAQANKELSTCAWLSHHFHGNPSWPTRQVLREWLPSGTAAVRLNIDATHRGNLARFFNHACDGGNLSLLLGRCVEALCLVVGRGMQLAAGPGCFEHCWCVECPPKRVRDKFQSILPPHFQLPAFRRTGSLLPRVVFITARPIAAGEELTYAYGPPNAGPQGRPCACGTAACRGFMPHEEV